MTTVKEQERWVEVVFKAQDIAIHELNATGEAFYDDDAKENRALLREIALLADPARTSWTNPAFWAGVLVAARGTGELKQRSTPEEAARRREAADRAAGKQKKISKDELGSSSQKDKTAIKKMLDGFVTDILAPKTKKIAAEVEWPDIDVKFEEYDSENLQKFKRLTTEQIRFFRAQQRNRHPEFFEPTKK